MHFAKLDKFVFVNKVGEIKDILRTYVVHGTIHNSTIKQINIIKEIAKKLVASMIAPCTHDIGQGYFCKARQLDK